MITLYTFGTPNGQKASILFEELNLPYQVQIVDIESGENKRPEYLRISPIGKLPAVLEDMPDGRRRLFGSGAIMLFYAEREGRLLPQDPDQRCEALSWFSLGIGDLGPTALDMVRFSVRAPERIAYAVDLFKGELMRCYHALEQRLSETEYLGGEYSIADIACFPFIRAAALRRENFLERFPAMGRWHAALSSRPTVQRGLVVPLR